MSVNTGLGWVPDDSVVGPGVGAGGRRGVSVCGHAEMEGEQERSSIAGQCQFESGALFVRMRDCMPLRPHVSEQSSHTPFSCAQAALQGIPVSQSRICSRLPQLRPWYSGSTST